MIGNSPYKEDIAHLFREGLELGRLHGKTILVAGATGLVGGCVVDVLMQNPARCYKVIAAGRNKERARQKFAAYWEDESFFFAEVDVTQPVIKSMNRMIGEPVYNELAEGADYIIDAASNASPNFFKQNPVEVMILARLLSPADYGIIGILTIFTLIAGNLQSSGFTQALVNIRKPTDNDYNSVFWFNVLVSLTMYVVLFFSAPLIADFFHQPCLTSLSRFVFLSFFISSFGIAQNGYMMKNMMNKEITIVNFMALISSNVVGLVLAFSGMAYWSLAWQQVIFILVLNIGRYYYTGWRPNFHIDFGPVRKMFGFSVKLLVTNIINTVSNNVLTFVFGRFYPINDVGNYSQAYNWDTKANSFVANTVGQIAQPVLASIQDDKNRELLVFRKMLRFTAFLSFPLMFGLTLVSREFILITIHEKWIASVPLLQILCVSGAFMPIYTLYQNLAISKGRSDVYMWCNIGQVVGLLALVLFCHQYGIQIMVIAYTVFIIAWLLVWQWMMKRVAGLRFLDVAKDILPFMLCAAATMVVTYFMTRSLQNIYLLLLVRLLVSATIYFCIMKLLKVQILEECIAFCKRGR